MRGLNWLVKAKKKFKKKIKAAWTNRPSRPHRLFSQLLRQAAHLTSLSEPKCQEAARVGFQVWLCALARELVTAHMLPLCLWVYLWERERMTLWQPMPLPSSLTDPAKHKHGRQRSGPCGKPDAWDWIRTLKWTNARLSSVISLLGPQYFVIHSPAD